MHICVDECDKLSVKKYNRSVSANILLQISENIARKILASFERTDKYKDIQIEFLSTRYTLIRYH